MKKLLLAVALFLVVSSVLVNLDSCSSPTTTNTIVHDTVYQHYWDPEQTGAAGTLLSVQFTGLEIGTAVGAGGTILQTTDYGATWGSQYSGTLDDLYGVSFANASTGMVVGSFGVVLMTTDGGSDWAPLTVNADVQFRNVLMLNTKTAYAIGTRYFSTDNTQGYVFKTSDGGVTWTQQTVTSAPGLYGISFADLMNGWVGGLDGTIFHTTDGGATWVKQSTGVPATQQVCNLSFSDATHGMAVGIDGVAGVSGTPAAGFILSTSDAGATWTKTATVPLDGISVADSKHAMAVGFSGTIMETSDAGATWSTKSVGSLRLLSVFLSDANHGVTVGENGEAFILGAH